MNIDRLRMRLLILSSKISLFILLLNSNNSILLIKNCFFFLHVCRNEIVAHQYNLLEEKKNDGQIFLYSWDLNCQFQQKFKHWTKNQTQYNNCVCVFFFSFFISVAQQEISVPMLVMDFQC